MLIFVGRNNTSKTYCAHTIYALHRFGAAYLAASVHELIREQKLPPLGDVWHHELSVVDFLMPHVPRFIRELGELVQTRLPKIFATDKQFFSKIRVEMQLAPDEESDIRKRLLAQELSYSLGFEDWHARRTRAPGAWRRRSSTEDRTSRSSSRPTITHEPCGGSRDADDGYRNLPDYVVFSEAQAKGKPPVLRALLVELKSSEAGKKRARRQIQLGAPLAHYLLSLAKVDHDAFKSTELHQAGLILWPDLPAPRPKTRKEPSGYDPERDTKIKIDVYDAPCGDDVYLDQFFYCPASV